MLLTKISWVLRGMVYKVLLGGFSMPSYLGPPSFLHRPKNIFVGKRVRIFPSLRAECHGEGRLFIHNNISIGQGFHVTCMGDLHIHEGTLITGYVSITDIEHDYEDVGVPVFDQGTTWKRTEIGRNCFIGMGARIQAGTVLGDGCIVGANAVVRGNFPDYCVIVGAPGRVIKRYDPLMKQWNRC